MRPPTTGKETQMLVYKIVARYIKIFVVISTLYMTYAYLTR